MTINYKGIFPYTDQIEETLSDENISFIAEAITQTMSNDPNIVEKGKNTLLSLHTKITMIRMESERYLQDKSQSI